ncbi:hypothetical protein BJ944DRAFT_167175 [Cunninghamella echinulata]|nr:hypothetical protein BJ944DRAFT_167175 [Cunninghamella echinulata]
MASEKINEELTALANKENEISQQVQAYHRNLLKPLWDERREIVKGIPNFWSEVLGNSPFLANPSERDIEALENLTDFHVEFDEDKPNYRKVVATFKKNDVFKNETLASNGKKRKSTEDEDEDDFATSLLEWFADDSEDSVQFGALLADEVFPAALELYNIDEDSGDEDEIELGSDSEDDEEEEEEGKQLKKMINSTF